jgi:hypothetical protein
MLFIFRNPTLKGCFPLQYLCLLYLAKLSVCVTLYSTLWLSNLSTLSVPDEGYSRNALCVLILISTFYNVNGPSWS